ncbi:MAG: GNAT family N-acetyltransferase [Planctomycetia bacterium]|nr:GNAT family N-acetyltransferase [Planctomycetia bacterium]
MTQPHHLLIRTAERQHWDEIAALVHDSTNAWYERNRGVQAFANGPESVRLFCETYSAIDPPDSILIAIDEETGRIAGSCFVHPRSTHVSLGIMNVHPDFFGRGVAPIILRRIVDFAKDERKPLHLVSSAMNLDSFSLYNRFGFRPYIVFQDMMIPNFSPQSISLDPKVARLAQRARPAEARDAERMCTLEKELRAMDRQGDFEYFIHNENGAWRTFVLDAEDGSLDGFLSSIAHPGSCMLGPGVMRTEAQMLALIYRALAEMGATPIFLVPSACSAALATLYNWGARNTEIHLGQCLGDVPQPKGIVMPTFMPETA